MVIYQLREEHPDWVFFDENYKGEYPTEIPIKNEDLANLSISKYKSKRK